MLGVLAIHENVKNIMLFLYWSSLHSSPINSIKFQYKLLFFLLQYLELRFNKYLRLCGTALFIIQTASKSQSSSLCLTATSILQLSVTGCFFWTVDEATTVHGWLGMGETKLFLQWGREWMLSYLPLWSLPALLSTQSSHLASAPCQETSDPSLQGGSVKSSGCLPARETHNGSET